MFHQFYNTEHYARLKSNPLKHIQESILSFTKQARQDRFLSNNEWQVSSMKNADLLDSLPIKVK